MPISVRLALLILLTVCTKACWANPELMSDAQLARLHYYYDNASDADWSRGYLQLRAELENELGAARWDPLSGLQFFGMSKAELRQSAEKWNRTHYKPGAQPIRLGCIVTGPQPKASMSSDGMFWAWTNSSFRSRFQFKYRDGVISEIRQEEMQGDRHYSIPWLNKRDMLWRVVARYNPIDIYDFDLRNAETLAQRAEIYHQLGQDDLAFQDAFDARGILRKKSSAK